MYDALIKRARKAIKDATMKVKTACVHKVTIDDDISELSGLVIVMHPDYIAKQKASEAADKNAILPTS